jgi:hypothetical protein
VGSTNTDAFPVLYNHQKPQYALQEKEKHHMLSEMALTKLVGVYADSHNIQIREKNNTHM